MTLPSDFIFTQNNLQDYADCPRRFELRHLLHLEWPAPQTEPIIEHERRMQQGEYFHRLVQQFFLDLPVEVLSSQAMESDLAAWWDAFLSDPFIRDLPANRQPELTLSMPFKNWRLLCKLDLLAIHPGGRFMILDWKTSSRATPRPALAARWQTRLYPFILQHAANHFNEGQPVQADRIEMVYWFAEAPARPERFSFSAEQSSRVEELLTRTLAEIEATAPGRFMLTADERRCAYCIYRSLCERGDQPGNLADSDADFEPPDTTAGLDLDQIGEILL